MAVRAELDSPAAGLGEAMSAAAPSPAPSAVADHELGPVRTDGTLFKPVDATGRPAADDPGRSRTGARPGPPTLDA
ncbi:hypothetical protein [Streptomyces humi]